MSPVDLIGVGFRGVCVIVGVASLWFEHQEGLSDSDGDSDVDLSERRDRLLAERRQALARQAAPPLEETNWNDDDKPQPIRAAAVIDADDRPREMRFITSLFDKLWWLPGLALIACGAFGAWLLGLLLLPVAILRGAYLRYSLWRAANRFMVGANMQRLIGQQAIVVWVPNGAQPGRVRLTNPVFKSSVIDCIADMPIKRGMRVMVLEVDCGLLKVAPDPQPKKA